MKVSIDDLIELINTSPKYRIFVTITLFAATLISDIQLLSLPLWKLHQ